MGSFLLELLDFVIFALFIMAMARKIGSLFRSPQVRIRTSRGGHPTAPAAGPHRGEMARDPVCGMFVSTELSQQLRRGPDTVHFCSRECMEKYQKDVEHAAS
jgi:YHS domain-containing protein